MIRSITAPAFSLCFGVVGVRGETKKKPWLYPHPNHETSALASFGLPKGQVEPEWVQWCFPKTEKVIKDIGMVHWLFYICFVCCPVWDFFLRFFLRLWEWATVTVINLKFLLVVGLWELWLLRKAPNFQALASKYNSWYNPVPQIDAYSFLLCYYWYLEMGWIRESRDSNLEVALRCQQEGSPAPIMVLLEHQAWCGP